MSRGMQIKKLGSLLQQGEEVVPGIWTMHK